MELYKFNFLPSLHFFINILDTNDMNSLKCAGYYLYYISLSINIYINSQIRTIFLKISLECHKNCTFSLVQHDVATTIYTCKTIENAKIGDKGQKPYI